MFSTKTILLRLLVSVLLGSVIGIEREYSNRPAGLRTHVLVCLGSCLIMLVSIDGYSQLHLMGGFRHADAARIAAQVVSGIGFLGAGTIMHNKKSIAGLTTAACLWVSAGLGLAVGCGYYAGAIGTAVLALIVLVVLRNVEVRANFSIERTLEIIMKDTPNAGVRVIDMVKENHGVVHKIKEVKWATDDSDFIYLTVDYAMRKAENILALNDALRENPDVKEIRHLSLREEE